MDVERVDQVNTETSRVKAARSSKISFRGVSPNRGTGSSKTGLTTLPTISPRKRLSDCRVESCISDSFGNLKLKSSRDIRELSDSETRGRLWGIVFTAMPAWLLSTMVHLIVLLTLTLFTFQDKIGFQTIVLEVADTSESLEVTTTDIAIEPLAFIEASELEMPEASPLDFASPDISSALIESVTLDVKETMDFSPLDGMGTIFGEELNQNLVDTDGRSKAKFFGIKSYGKRFVFVIDCSGSMKGSRWRRAVEELRYAVNGLERDQEFLVLLYNTRTKVMFDSDLQSAALSVATSDNKRRMFNWLKKQLPAGSTFPGPAVYAALRLRPDAVFLLSDGLLKDNTVNWLRQWNAPQSEDGEFNTGKIVPMNTISLDTQGEWVMRTIANQNGGVFVSAR